MNEIISSAKFVKSSGNVFADMDLEDAEELFARAYPGCSSA